MLSALGQRRGAAPATSPAPRSVWNTPSNAASFAGWFWRHGAPEQVAHRELQRGEQRGHAQAEREPAPVVAVAAPAQQPDGVDRG